MNELALFAGAGGGILGGKILGWRTVCAVEFAAYPRSVLLARQRDGILEPFPIWDDVQTFDGKPWLGRVDVVSGGFPCQDISIAGNGDGLDGERSGLWKEMGRIIGEVRPRFVLVENSPMLVIRGLNRVLGDIAALGYDARWGIISARDAGAPHQRDRIWIVAHAQGERDCGICHNGNNWEYKEPKGETRGGGLCENVANPNGPQRKRGELSVRGKAERTNPYTSGDWWANDPAALPESRLGRVVARVAPQVDRLKAIGNGQVPAVVALAWRILSQ